MDFFLLTCWPAHLSRWTFHLSRWVPSSWVGFHLSRWVPSNWVGFHLSRWVPSIWVAAPTELGGFPSTSVEPPTESMVSFSTEFGGFPSRWVAGSIWLGGFPSGSLELHRTGWLPPSSVELHPDGWLPPRWVEVSFQMISHRSGSLHSHSRGTQIQANQQPTSMSTATWRH